MGEFVLSDGCFGWFGGEVVVIYTPVGRTLSGMETHIFSWGVLADWRHRHRTFPWAVSRICWSSGMGLIRGGRCFHGLIGWRAWFLMGTPAKWRATDV